MNFISPAPINALLYKKGILLQLYKYFYYKQNISVKKTFKMRRRLK